jgi:uncharacterized protein (DUF1778 family)
MDKIGKTEIIAFRMSKWELKELEKALKITKQTKSNFISNAVLEKVQKVIK